MKYNTGKGSEFTESETFQVGNEEESKRLSEMTTPNEEVPRVKPIPEDSMKVHRLDTDLNESSKDVPPEEEKFHPKQAEQEIWNPAPSSR
eukprot:CAMPEP_0170507460 /NCGR_PEP_ID=MMETSP0208-20121228/58904_1 /TAXON_ID=197538 /ORGANISM="Strombidium inclinatum, Strain S3" /LENGTH=89 /DNA_ID=CAMNT_0010789657 /DNA_START=1903 /DNA_END=2172 /DNA_ORIENTATION=+